MNTYSIYVLQSDKDGRLYVGLSANVMKRIEDHHAGRVFSTQAYRPWKMVYQEIVGTRLEARAREKYLKSGSGKEFIKRVLLKR